MTDLARRSLSTPARKLSVRNGIPLLASGRAGRPVSAATGQASWATCPLTENALRRILGTPRYPNCPGTPAAVSTVLTGMKRLPGHVFWPDDVGITDEALVDVGRLLTHRQVTDTYLLALARAHRASSPHSTAAS